MQKLITLMVLLIACDQAKTQFSAEQVKEDITYLQQQLQEYHPGFYRYTSKEKMDKYFRDAKQVGGLNDIGLYQRLNFLISKVGCGHTRASMPDAMREQFMEDQRFLPVSLKFLGDKVYVRQSLDDRLLPGWELVAIDDEPMDAIQQQIYQYLSADGTIETGKARRAEVLFDAYYQLFIDSTATSYTLDLRNEGGESKVVQVEGVSQEEVNAIRASFSGDYLSFDQREDYAYMRIRTFSSQALRNDGYDYEQFLADSFKALNESGTQNLILDLRGNGGGKDEFGAQLVSYLAQDSYGYFDRIEVTKAYPGRSDKVGDQYLMTRHTGLDIWQPNENRFTGNIYVLIDGFSFSTCADVATVLHHRRWATFLGEETGGGYDGNTSGHSRTITLPNSEISVNVPMWMYTTANVGHNYPGRGVIPDYPVTPTWEQFERGQDAVLEKAIQLLTND
ncbi:S41 family peptidase [Ekhidna sp. To15]|uniref:S41 family peptidase n=1 Tax=Ekhidna sp. To15 TaxID=3395267 RepID=UPI003F5219E0